MATPGISQVLQTKQTHGGTAVANKFATYDGLFRNEQGDLSAESADKRKVRWRCMSVDRERRLARAHVRQLHALSPAIFSKQEKYMTMVNSFYDLVTDFYEYGWGESFHFACAPSTSSRSSCSSRRACALRYTTTRAASHSHRTT